MKAQAFLSALSLSTLTHPDLSLMPSTASVSKTWEALGPFPLGTRELPYLSSPLAAFTKGNQTEEELFLGLDFKEGLSEFPSSYAVDGKVSWGRFQENEAGWVEVGWEGVDWPQVRRTEGWASLQYLTLLRTSITISGSSSSAIPVNLDLTQAHSFAIVPKTPSSRSPKTALRWHTGDIYAYSDEQARSAGFPSKLTGWVEELEAGEYQLLVKGLYETRMFGDPKESSPKIRFRFGVEAVSSSPVLLGVEDAQIGFPDVVDGWLFGEVAGIALRAGGGKDGVSVRAVELVEKIEGLTISLYPSATPITLVPYQNRPVALSINQTSPLPSNLTSLTLRVILSSPGNIEDSSAPLMIILPLTHRSHWSSDSTSYPALRYTHLDLDLTVQYTMTQPPLLPADGTSSAVILATHGAGVETSSPFWTEALGERRKGLGWVVFATGKTPWGYDWHGASAESAFAARKALGKVVLALEGKRKGNEEGWGVSTKTFLVGHSNGGQGASYLLERYPDEFLGSVSAAGYLKIQAYVAYTQWASSHFIDPALWGILVSSLASFENDVHASNAAHLPFMLVHGTEDDNVPVWHSRELKSLVDRWTGNTSSVVLQEVPGESHWFDGIVSSPEVRSFLDTQLLQTGPPRDAYSTKGFTLTVSNVNENGSKGGWKILELDQPGRLARLQVSPLRDNDLSTLRLKTTNARRISFSPSIASSLASPPTTLQIDSTVLSLLSSLSTSDAILTLYRPNLSSPWSFLDSPISTTPPRVSGPILRILTSEGPLLLVVPSLASEQEVEIAKRIAHDAFVYARLDAEILTAEEATRRVEGGGKGLEGSLVVIGGWKNEFGRELNSTAVSLPTADTFSVASSAGPRTFDPKNSPSTGLLSLHPHPTNQRGLALHLAGTDSAGLERAYRLFPVRTGTPLPDWIILGAQADWQGAGGVEAAGFFGPEWNYNDGMSWTS